MRQQEFTHDGAKLDARERLFRIPGPIPGLSLFLRYLPPADRSGTRIETTLRDYLEAWGESTFSAPREGA